MAQMAMRLPVFVASPSDVATEREIADEEITLLAREAARHRLLLEPFRWEIDAQPGFGRPNSQTNRVLATSELAVIIFWTSLGTASTVEGFQTGTIEELHLGWQQVRRGASDDLFVYFRAEPSTTGTAKRAEVLDLRTRLTQDKSLYYFDYNDPAHFRKLFSIHLRRWLERWYHVPEICEFALENIPPSRMPKGSLPETRLPRLRNYFDANDDKKLTGRLGQCATLLYQQHGLQGFMIPLPLEERTRIDKLHRLAEPVYNLTGPTSARPSPPSSQPLVSLHDNKFRFSDPEWFCYFCAIGLIEAILTDDPTVAENLPYVNEVHQLLPVLAGEARGAIVACLANWLTNKNGATSNKPIARNFAAYALGMLQAHEAQDALAEAAINDKGFEVDRYAIAALGKLRARRHMPLLVELFFAAQETQQRLEISQAICRLSGLAAYEL